MAIDIHVTLDTFLWKWEEIDEGEVWLCVQPHVKPQDLGEWINNANTGNNFNYRLVQNDCNSNTQYIPISFSGNSNLTLRLYNSIDPLVTHFRESTNNRREGINITDVQAFREENVEQVSALTHSDSSIGEIRDMASGPFASSYIQSVIEAYNETGEDVTALVNMLILAFWGGKPRRLPLVAADNLEIVNLMKLPVSDDGILLTNIHSLNGLMFKIGLKSEIDLLKNIKQIELTIEQAAGSREIVSRSNGVATENYTAYFSKLATATIEKPDDLVDNLEINNLRNRVYLIDNLIPFSPVKVGNEIWFQRRSESQNIVDNSRLNKLRRMVVHLKNDEGNQPKLEEYEKVKTLEWNVYQTFEAQLAPYRKANVIAETPSNNKCPLRLTPSKQISEIFYEEVKDACENGQFRNLGIEIFGDDGSQLDLELIDCYEFPWDQISPEDNQKNPNVFTLLYYGTKPESSDVIVRIKRPLFEQNQIQDYLETTLQYPPPMNEDNLWGERLEVNDLKEINGEATYKNEKLSSATFNTLTCSPGNELEIDEFRKLLDRLAPGVAFSSDLHFEFSQSLSRIETLMEISYPSYTLPQTPSETDPEQEYRNDLVNHNAIDSVVKWRDRQPETLSDKGQIFSVGSIKSGSECMEESVKQYFKVAHRLNVDPKPVNSNQPPNIRTFFNELYKDTGKERKLLSELEHTYGTKFGIDDIDQLRSHFDYPVTLASEISISNSDTLPQTCELSSNSALVTVKYKKPQNNAGEKVELKFNQELLDDDLFQNEKCRPVYIEAWRSIAELVWADSISIKGLFYLFDINEAVQNYSAGKSKSQLIDALRLISNTESWKIDITNEIKTKCREWLESDSGEIQDPTLDFSLPSLNGKPIGEVCHVFELLIEVERNDEKYPKILGNGELNIGPWELKRATPKRDTKEGQEVINGESPITKSLFKEFLESLKLRKGRLLLPESNDTQSEDFDNLKKSKQFKNLIGDTKNNDEPENSHSWILPLEISPPTSSQKVTASVCPLTFLPLKRNSYLGDLTSPLIRKYFYALGQVLELGVSGNWNTWDAARWKIHFNQIKDNLNGNDSFLNKLFTNLTNIAVPIPPEKQDDVSSNNCNNPSDSNCTLNPKVEEIVVEFNKNDQNPTPLQKSWRRWLRNRLFVNPGLFDEAKAFLYTNLYGETSNSSVNKDFCQMVSQKLIREDPNNETNSSTPVEYYMFRQGLLDLLNVQQSQRWFGFYEVLDDVSYDNEFQFRSFELRSFEYLIEQLNGTINEQTQTISLVDDKLNLPFGEYKNNIQNDCSFVKLASRKPLSTPIHILTDKFKLFQEKAAFDGLTGGTSSDPIYYSYQKLKDKSENFDSLETNEPVLRLRAKTTSFNRSERLDDYVLSALFIVKASEEYEEGAIQAFGNDSFYINKLNTLPETNQSEPASVPGKVQSVFNNLSQNQLPVQISNPDEIIDSTVLEFVSEAILPIENDETNVPKNNQFCIVEESGKPIVKFSDNSQTNIEVAFFEFFNEKPPVPSDNEREQRSDTYLILVNYQLSVWQESAMGLVQERNALREFAPAFQQTSVLSTSQQKYQPIITVDLSKERQDLPLNLTSRNISASDLIKMALRLNTRNPLTEDNSWRNYDLSITVFHRQETPIRTLFINNRNSREQGLKQILGKSHFPLLTERIGANETTQQNRTVIWFEDQFNDFSIDFQWSSQSNLQFFRVQNFYVHFDN